MKIENKEIGIKIGNKERKFTNMILDSYLDLFASSFLEFQNKDLPYCLVNFTKNNTNINEQSTEMQYDTILEADLLQNVEILTDNSIINKYYYRSPLAMEKDLSEFSGQQIRQLGFANYDYNLSKYVIYAYIDVSKYNIIIQDNQPVVISRVDKITSDMNLWKSDKRIKAPVHLTMRAMNTYLGMEYTQIKPKLYSVGFGVLPYTLNKEFLIEDLTIEKTETGTIQINNVLETEYNPNTLFFSDDLKMSDDLLLRKPSYDLLIYKFKLYKETYPDLESPPVLVDTGMWYTQYKKLSKYGKIKLSVKYERS